MWLRTLIGKALCAYIGTNNKTCQPRSTVSYRHRYRCWLCRYEGVLEFEPDASEPGWTECHDCGTDNEIPPGLYDRPALISGHVPSRIF